MNEKLKKLLIDLGFCYGFISDDNHHIFENENMIITFDYDYEFVSFDNNKKEVQINFDDLILGEFYENE